MPQQQAKEHSAKEHIEGDLDVDVAAQFPLLDCLQQERPPFLAAREDEVIAKRTRELRVVVRCCDDPGSRTADGPRKYLNHSSELLPE